jgi:hypothetical protein
LGKDTLDLQDLGAPIKVSFNYVFVSDGSPYPSRVYLDAKINASDLDVFIGATNQTNTIDRARSTSNPVSIDRNRGTFSEAN